MAYVKTAEQFITQAHVRVAMVMASAGCSRSITCSVPRQIWALQHRLSKFYPVARGDYLWAGVLKISSTLLSWSKIYSEDITKGSHAQDKSTNLRLFKIIHEHLLKIQDSVNKCKQ